MSLIGVGTPCLPVNRNQNWNHTEVVKVFHMVSKPVLSVLVAKVNTVVIKNQELPGLSGPFTNVGRKTCSNQIGLIGVTLCLKNCY